MARWSDEDEAAKKAMAASSYLPATEEVARLLVERLRAMSSWNDDNDELALGLLEAHLRATGDYHQSGAVWAPSLAGRPDAHEDLVWTPSSTRPHLPPSLERPMGTDDRDDDSNPRERPAEPMRPADRGLGISMPGKEPPPYDGPRGPVRPTYREGQGFKITMSGKPTPRRDARRRKPWWRRIFG